MDIKRFLSDTYVRPFKSAGLNRTYTGSFLALAGISCVNLYVAFDYAGAGAFSVLSFFLVRYLFGGVVLLPLSFAFLREHRISTYFKITLVLQFLALASFFFGGVMTSPWLTAIMLVILEAPFWLAVHVAMLLHTSDDNRGNEVVISDAGVTLGTVTGLFAGGVLLSIDAGTTMIAVAAGFIFAGTVIVDTMLARIEKDTGSLSPPQEGKSHALSAMFSNPERSICTVTEGMFQAATYFLAPVFLNILGASGMLTGVLQAVGVLIKAVLSPFTGFLINRNCGLDVFIGGMTKFCGWLPWLFLQTPYLLVFSSIFWTTGTHMYCNGLLSRWYRNGDLSAMMAREILLAAGRCAAICIAVPLIYLSVEYFILAATAISLLLLASAFFMKRRARREMESCRTRMPFT